MATPALSHLQRHLGTDNLGILALKGGIAELSRASGWFGQVHVWDPDRENLAKGLACLADIRRRRYTHALSLFPTFHWKFKAFALASGAGTRLGFAHPAKRVGSGLLGGGLTLPADPLAHDTDQNLRLVETWVGRRHPGPIRLSWPLPADGAAWRRDLLTLHRQAGGRAVDYVVMHPGSSAERGMADKRMPPAVFAACAVRLYREFGLASALAGGPEEADLRAEIQALVAAQGEPLALLEAKTRHLTDLGGLIAGARLYLGNDSGLMHMAVSLGLPCMVFFGPTDPRRTGPYGERERVGGRPRHLVIAREDLACRPCRTGVNVGSQPVCVTRDVRCLRDFGVEIFWPRLADFVHQVMH